ncbi:MAG: type II CRISPR RNA-guided endonuclease Cas9, partial [Christensenellaceae bacterium]|nr:type II CRISPR RNA-guided endonuclease Cas9 [Christensenellaceae bacterium]
DHGVPEEIFENILSIGNFTKFGHLSVIACNKIIPHLEEGMIYNEACAEAGYDFKAHGNEDKSVYLKLTDEDLEPITSPVAKRSISQTVKVVNAIIRSRGGESPSFINIEVAREMAKDFSERKLIEKQNKENQGFNERIKEEIICELGKQRPNGQDIIKLKLFHEQAERCMYTQKPIKRELLFDPGYVEIDHIVPYSISFDDRMCNKVLVLAKENQDKGNRLPMEYLSGERRDDYVVWVESTVRDFRKRQLLLKEHITENDRKGFRERNLQDTKTISRFMMNFINDNLKFAESGQRKKHVTAVNGAITSYLRKRWGIVKIRENGDLHHAVDAVVIGCATDGMIQQISRYNEWKECQYIPGAEGSMALDPYTGEVLREFPYPWPKFRVELDARLSGNPEKQIASLALPFYEENAITVRKPFVSRMPKRKVTGAAHKETAKSLRTVEDGKKAAVIKTALSNLKLDKDGEIANYYDPNSDRLLYNALKERLLEFGGKGEKAFKEDFHKPKSDGTPGPIVRKVKIYEPTTLNVPILDKTAVADNDSMVRVDVFHVENDGYYLVPIYVADTLKTELPNKACVANKPYSEWKEMKDDDFIFSLYPNDLICVTHKNEITLTKNNKDSSLPEKYSKKTEFLYYKKMGIAN